MENIRILIIDDETPAREIIRHYLKDVESSEVVGECSDGFSGLKSITTLKPDLVFLDIAMPRMNGFEMLLFLEALTGIDWAVAGIRAAAGQDALAGCRARFATGDEMARALRAIPSTGTDAVYPGCSTKSTTCFVGSLNHRAPAGPSRNWTECTQVQSAATSGSCENLATLVPASPRLNQRCSPRSRPAKRSISSRIFALSALS
ncbi:MAG: response regulator, partial [Chlorobiales bacterium]|nr:response regulator [Chlorobiales bacterium]